MIRWALLPVAAAVAFSAPQRSNATGEPAAPIHAEAIRAEVDTRYRSLRGRGLAVIEASTTSVVDSLTLLSDADALPRVVAADNGVYYAICPLRASCPYPSPFAAWPARAYLPRRLAFELALRTFRETDARLVVVALPTAAPVWVVVERDRVLRGAARAGMRTRRGDLPAFGEARRGVVERLTRPLYVPVALGSYAGETAVAAPLLDDVPPSLRIRRVSVVTAAGRVVRLALSLHARDGAGAVAYSISAAAGGGVLVDRSGHVAGRASIALRVRPARVRTVTVRTVVRDPSGNVATAVRTVHVARTMR